MTPRFSVVIPTRERAETLRSCLQTCLDQEFDSYEIVVCDNHSTPATQQVVAEFASPRIRYVRSPEPLAMSDNWELALSHARGEYVTILGDDDGLLSHGLRQLDFLIQRSGAKALRWGPALYLWPTISLPGEGNFLRLPLRRQVCVVNGRQAIDKVIRFQAEYTLLPMLYNAVIHQELIRGVRAKAGRVFLNNCPDVYSGFIFAYAASEYLSTDVPMSISGLSGHSNGIATLLLRNKHRVAKEYHDLNKQANLLVHRHIPDLPIFPAVPVADSFQQAKEALFPEDDLTLDRKLLAAQCVAGLVVDDDDEWRECYRLIRETLLDDAELLNWFDATFSYQPKTSNRRMRLRPDHLGFEDNQMLLDTTSFQVHDVAGAVKLCEQLLQYRGATVRYEFVDQIMDESPEQQLHRQLVEKEQVIQVLATAAEARARVICELENRLNARGNTIPRIMARKMKRFVQSWFQRKAG